MRQTTKEVKFILKIDLVQPIVQEKFEDTKG